MPETPPSRWLSANKRTVTLHSVLGAMLVVSLVVNAPRLFPYRPRQPTAGTPSPPPRPVDKLLPGGSFDPAYFAREANRMQALGRDRALEELYSPVSRGDPVSDPTSWDVYDTICARLLLVRVLFDQSSEGVPIPSYTIWGELPGRDRFEPSLSGPAGHCPKYPLLIVDDLPFVVGDVNLDIRSIFPWNGEALAWARDHGSFRSTPLTPTSDVYHAARKAMDTVAPVLAEEDVAWVDDQIRRQATTLLPAEIQPPPDSCGRRAVLSWEELRLKLSAHSIKWDGEKGEYVVIPR